MDSCKKLKIETGILLAGTLDSVDRQAIDDAVAEAKRLLTGWITNIAWHFELVRRDEWVDDSAVEPTDLLGQAREDRDEKEWDFAYVLTSADLVSHYKPYSLAVISNSLDIGIISTARIDPKASAADVSEIERVQEIRNRLVRLFLHLLGHWLGLEHTVEANNVMHDINSIEELASAVEFNSEQCDRLQRAAADIADQRLEEKRNLQRAWLPKFYALAAWENKSELYDTLFRAKPWEFPIRLSRLTTAAVSTVVVLLMTAETWDMAMSQTWLSVAGLFLVAILATTAYITTRQQLLLRRNGREITEQIVTTNISAVAIVVFGMSVSFLLLCSISLVASLLLFPDRVIEAWAVSVKEPIRLKHYLLMAATVGSLGNIIGALGASFEQQHHFRHVIFVDEEV